MSSATAAPALSSTNLAQALRRLATTYATNTPTRLKLVDAFLLFVLVSGLLVFSYCVLAGSFPYNSFLAGFISTVGTFVLAGTTVGLTASLRFQCSDSPDHQDLTVERAFADFVFGNLILHLFVINYMG